MRSPSFGHDNYLGFLMRSCCSSTTNQIEDPPTCSLAIETHATATSFSAAHQFLDVPASLAPLLAPPGRGTLRTSTPPLKVAE